MALQRVVVFAALQRVVVFAALLPGVFAVLPREDFMAIPPPHITIMGTTMGTIIITATIMSSSSAGLVAGVGAGAGAGVIPTGAIPMDTTIRPMAMVMV